MMGRKQSGTERVFGRSQGRSHESSIGETILAHSRARPGAILTAHFRAGADYSRL